LRLTFRGKPVKETYGIHADFAGQALDKFTNAVVAIAASLKGKLGEKGPIPERQQNQLLVVGPALGSFGFELELPVPDEKALFEEIRFADESIKKIQAIFQAITTDGTDEELSELIDEVHPRAVTKVYEFLEYQLQNEAWCGLDFDGHVFRFQNAEQLKKSAPRLAKDNIAESETRFEGTLIGVMPSERRFELELKDRNIKKGRTDLIFDEGKQLSRYIMKDVNMTLREIRVGQGNPRYILESLENVVPASNDSGE